MTPIATISSGYQGSGRDVWRLPAREVGVKIVWTQVKLSKTASIIPRPSSMRLYWKFAAVRPSTSRALESALLDAGQAPGAKCGTAAEYPDLLELDRIRVIAGLDFAGRLADRVVEHISRELHRRILDATFSPRAQHVGRAHRDVLEPVDVARGPQSRQVVFQKIVDLV